MIYLASPYSDPSADVREERYREALLCTAHLLRRSLWVYSPIVHCHELAKHHDLPKDFQFWQRYNFHMLKHAYKLLVLNIPGWQNSVGVTAEIEFARGMKLPCALVEVVGKDLVYEAIKDAYI